MKRKRRVRFRFKAPPPPPPPPIDIEGIAKNLVEACEAVNSARDKYRQTVSKIAGTDISEWSFQEVQRYANGMYRIHIDQKNKGQSS